MQKNSAGIGQNNGLSRFQASYQAQLSQMTKQAEGFYKAWQNGDLGAKAKFDALVPSIRNLQKEFDGFSRTIGTSHSQMGLFASSLDRMKSHGSWLASGLLLGSFIGLPLAIAKVTKETEALQQKIRQNIELSNQYHDNNKLLEADMQRLGNIASVYAVGYGENLSNVLNSMIIISRRFKSLDMISYLTSVALTISRIDQVPLDTVTANLESALLQFQLTGKEIREFSNDLTVLVHVAKLNGTEVFQALSRSAATFKEYGFSAREALAVIGATMTETGKTAATVGQSWKSILANLSMDKAIQALDAYGIKLYEIQENGMKRMRPGVNVFAELRELYTKLDDEAQQKLSLALAGGKFQVSNMIAFLSDKAETFETILNDITIKSSDALTASLLKLGLQTWQVKLMQLEASLEVFGKTIGNSVLPELKNMTDGLTNGVMWLSSNSEAVENTVRALIQLGEVLIAYSLKQKVANAAIAEGTTLLRLMYLMEGDFKTAFYGMGTSLKNFGMVAASLTVQLAALYAAINIISAAYDRFTDKSGLTGQQQDLTNQIQSLETGRAYALANAARTGVSSDEVNRSYDAQKADLQAKLEAVNNAIKEKDNKAYSKAQEESSRSFQAMIDKALAQAEKAQATIGNQIPGKNKGSGLGSAYAPDRSQELFKLDKGREVDHLFSQAKIDADNYAMSLDKVNAKIDIFGLNAETSTERLNLMHQRIADLIGRSMEYQSLSNNFEKQANEMVQNNQQLKGVLDSQRISWTDLSKQEKKDFAEKYKDYVADYKALTRLLDLVDELRVKAADVSKEANKIGVDTVRLSVNDPRSIYEQKIRNSILDSQHGTSGLGRFATQQKKNLIDLKYSIEQLAAAEAELNRIENEYGNDSSRYKEQQGEVDRLKEKVEELRDKWYSVREGLAGITSEVLTEGATLRSIWNKLWNDLANDALKALFRVQNNTPSLLGSILGLFGGGGYKVYSGSGNAFAALTKAHSGENIKKMHSGGIVGADLKEDETLRVLQIGERVLSREQNESFSNMMAGFKKGIEVVPYLKNPSLANGGNITVQVQQNQGHIEELRKQNAMMAHQNNMIAEMVAKGNGSVVVLPVAPSAEQVLKIIEANPDALFNVINKGRNLGYR